jgi:hypothetical protein
VVGYFVIRHFPFTFILPKRDRPSIFRIIMDTNYWGLWCVPLGLAICFGPALVAAALCRPDKTDSNSDKPANK